MIVVAKVGTSSITNDAGEIEDAAIAKFCAEAVTLRRSGHRVVMVTSGAIAAGLPADLGSIRDLSLAMADAGVPLIAPSGLMVRPGGRPTAVNVIGPLPLAV